MRILVTGNTGFKGSWLVALLHRLGHEIIGVSTLSEDDLLFPELVFKDRFENISIDIRNFEKLRQCFLDKAPDFIIHFAACSTVTSEDFDNTYANVSTNSIGTLNLLLASEGLKNLQGRLIATTDKVYLIKSGVRLTEDSKLLGIDPYSKSKVLADILTQNWQENFPAIPTAIVRAGNVIGGGDFKKSRLIPDIFYSLKHGHSLILRNPEQSRPWQYILDCLTGYVLIMNQIINSKKSSNWNLGPLNEEVVSAQKIVDIFLANFKNFKHPKIQVLNSSILESSSINLDSSKLRSKLKYASKHSVSSAVNQTAIWYKRYLEGKSVNQMVNEELEEYIFTVKNLIAM